MESLVFCFKMLDTVYLMVVVVVVSVTARSNVLIVSAMAYSGLIKDFRSSKNCVAACSGNNSDRRDMYTVQTSSRALPSAQSRFGNKTS